MGEDVGKKKRLPRERYSPTFSRGENGHWNEFWNQNREGFLFVCFLVRVVLGFFFCFVFGVFERGTSQFEGGIFLVLFVGWVFLWGLLLSSFRPGLKKN